MCGLTALLSPAGDARLPEVLAMTDLVRHRGPDSEGYCVVADDWVRRLSGPDTLPFVGAVDLPMSPSGPALGEDLAGYAVLGHRRLSIVDLSVAGHQPMTDRDGRVWITFNGEIYNFIELRERLRGLSHSFTGHSDTEVLLAAYREWGEDFLRELVGMFALVLVDRDRRRVLAARDHFGIKPLYFWQLPSGAVALASEIKSFTALPEWAATVNGPRLYDFLAFGIHDHTDETMFAGIRQLRGGELLDIDLSRPTAELRPRRWWSLQPAAFEGSFEDAAQEFADRFRDSVHLQLRADVPVGSCLSGGLDSSSIVCMANDLFRRSGEPFSQRVFTAASEDPRIDEAHWARLVADRTGVEMATVTPTMAEVPTLLPSLAWHLDEPFGSTSIVAQWHVFALAAEHGITVMLDGQGADEQLAGYSPYFARRFHELLRATQLSELVRELRAVRDMHGGLTRLAMHTAQLLLPPAVARRAGRLTSAASQRPDEWLDRGRLGVAGRPDPVRESGALDPGVRALSVSQLTASNLPMLLHYEDRDSMAHSIEARVPFLDHRLVELVVGMPSSYLIAHGTTKRVMREGLRGVLLDEVRTRTDKIGFQTAEEQWVRGAGRKAVLALAEESVVRSNGLLTPGALTRVHDLVDGRTRFDFWLWRVISTGAWLNAFAVKV